MLREQRTMEHLGLTLKPNLKEQIVQSEEKQDRRENEEQTLALKATPGSFIVAPKLILIPPSTNLYDTPASWLLNSNEKKLAHYRQSLTTFLEQQENDSTNGNAPDFASDNQMLRELLSWKFSDRMVSCVIQKFGNTLILQSMAPTFTGPNPALPQHEASLISGFDIDAPTASLAFDSSAQTTPLEEQARLRAQATKEILARKALKKNAERQRRAQLLSKLHCRILEGNDFRALSPEDSVTVHQWRHNDHQVALTSDVMVYSHKKKATSLNLRDEREGPHSRASIARLFLDNVMASVPQLAVCWHEDGIIRRYDTFKTYEIPQKMNEQEPIDVTDIERGATALLAFLKTFCVEDLSVHWLFKAKGEHIARLWRLDPINDCSLSWEFRDKILYQMSMLCLRASHAIGRRDIAKHRLLLSRCAEMLDAASLINDMFNHSRVCRRALRAGVKERLMETIVLQAQEESDHSKASNLIYGLDVGREAIQLLQEEEASSTNASLQMVWRSQRRLKERCIHITQMMLQTAIRCVDQLNSTEIVSKIEELARICMEDATQLIKQAMTMDDEDERPDTLVMLLQEGVIAARVSLGEFFMRMARVKVQEMDAQSADSFIEKAIQDCFTTDEIYDEVLAKKIHFLRGHAWNERGKLYLLSGSRVLESKDCFSKALEAFTLVDDKENILVAHCNLAHCYRVASVSGSSSEEKLSLLRLAEKEISQMDDVPASWQGRLKGELFRTRLMIGVESPVRDEATKVLQEALDCASTAEEQATVQYHLALTRMKSSMSPTDLKLVKRGFERILELVPVSSPVRLFARMELIPMSHHHEEDALKAFFASKEVEFMIQCPTSLKDIRRLFTKLDESVSTVMRRWKSSDAQEVFKNWTKAMSLTNSTEEEMMAKLRSALQDMRVTLHIRSSGES